MIFIASMWRNFLVLVKTDIQLRYYRSWWGYVWSLLKPLSLALVLLVVFPSITKMESDMYAWRILYAVLLWQVFQEGTSIAITSLAAKTRLLKHTTVSPVVVIISSIWPTLIGLGSALFLWFFLYSLMVEFSVVLIGITLLTLLWVSVWTLFFGFCLAIMAVFYPTIISVWEGVLQLGFYLAPLIYPMKLIPEVLQKYLWLHPLTPPIELVSWHLSQTSELPVIPWDMLFFLLLTGMFLLVFNIVLYRFTYRFLAEKS